MTPNDSRSERACGTGPRVNVDVEFELNDADLNAALKESQVVERARAAAIVGGIITAIAVVVAVRTNSSGVIKYLPFGIVLAALSYFVPRFALQKARDVLADTGRWRRVRVTGWGVMIDTRTSQARLHWEHVPRLVESKTHFLVTLQGNSILPLPKRVLSDADQSELRAHRKTLSRTRTASQLREKASLALTGAVVLVVLFGLMILVNVLLGRSWL